MLFLVQGEASEIIFWALAIILGSYLAYLSKEYYDKIIIMGTAVIGALSTMIGISLLFDPSFLKENDILTQLSNDTIDPIFYTYVAGFVFTFAAGAFY
jgi:hypothetical protein